MTSTILNAMEAVATRSMTSYERYGSSVLKQGYIYGSLDTGPSVLRRGLRFTWRVGAGCCATPCSAWIRRPSKACASAFWRR